MLSALAGLAGNLVGGLLGKSNADKANKVAAKQNAQQLELADRNIALQQQFAKEGIRWKVEDAKRAGIHPLYALGANTVSYSPVSVGSVPHTVDTSLPNAFANMGQDLGRAIDSTRTTPEKIFARQLTSLQLEGLQLDNDIKRATYASSIARLAQEARPSFPGAVGQDTVPTNAPALTFFGRPWKTSPYVSNAEDGETRYGSEGPGAWIPGGLAFAEDWRYNTGAAIPFHADWLRLGHRLGQSFRN